MARNSQLFSLNDYTIAPPDYQRKAIWSWKAALLKTKPLITVWKLSSLHLLHLFAAAGAVMLYTWAQEKGKLLCHCCISLVNTALRQQLCNLCPSWTHLSCIHSTNVIHCQGFQKYSSQSVWRSCWMTVIKQKCECSLWKYACLQIHLGCSSSFCC